MSEPRFKVGDRVFHRGSKQHATVLEVVPKHSVREPGYNAEYRVKPDHHNLGGGACPGEDCEHWWANYHTGPESEAPW